MVHFSSQITGRKYLIPESVSIHIKTFYPASRMVGGAMVLGKLPVLGRTTNLDDYRTMAFCAYSRFGWGPFGYFFSSIISLFYSLKGQLNSKQPTDQIHVPSKHIKLTQHKIS